MGFGRGVAEKARAVGVAGKITHELAKEISAVQLDKLKDRLREQEKEASLDELENDIKAIELSPESLVPQNNKGVHPLAELPKWQQQGDKSPCQNGISLSSESLEHPKRTPKKRTKK